MDTEVQCKARDLNHAQRGVLIVHVTGKQTATRGCKTTYSLMTRGLIRYVGAKGESNSPRPTHTVITEEGREVVCAVLGEYADALVASSEFLEKISAPSIVGLDRQLALAKLMTPTR